MCFRVVFDKTVIGRLPSFSVLSDNVWPEGDISAFTFPTLPILASDEKDAFPAAWGLIPSWVKDGEQARKIRSATVNARSETVREKPSFRYGWPKRRCILPVRGFFEPHLGPEGKEDWRIERRDGDIFFLGGLYGETPSSLTDAFYARTFSLLTLEARGFLAEVHNEKKRMPLLITREKAELWLGSEGEEMGFFHSFWQMDQVALRGEITKKDKKKSEILKETSLFSIFN